ncbi:hypothetical protein BC938DRAFT_470878 [Jimgerdemannia flammicorona]|uniref:Uncharacterized protein n=1 Tax=Jimgerdemannia flammicorona TaxID=994334 RepID=A0A433QV33_9FUNG|nr:hypothetical protein BC938DRAFT_470878 [Jimgerdemannia flammicorona]
MTVYCYRRLDVGLSKTLRTRLHVSATNSIKQLIFFFPEWRCKRSSFRNPAAIFLAVAQQYSRKFRKIVFAITEDHNSITTTNPAGNYDIFSLYLDHTNLGPGIPTLPPVTVLPVTVPMVATCSFGGCCDKFDTTHTKEFYHPPSCPFDKGCKNTDDHHIFLFRHIKPCKRKGLCIEHDDPGHAELFSHPSHCENGGGCTSMEDAHLQQFLHVPVCAEGVACSNREVKQHAEKFRHIKSQCPYGSFCGQYMVVPHMEQCVHPFNTPCRGTPFACTNMDAKHVAKFSHVCKYGAACPELLDLNHVKNTIHVVRTQCPHGANCMHLLNEKHLNLFSHLEIADIRSACKYGQGTIICIFPVVRFVTPRKFSPVMGASPMEYAHTSEGPPISSYDDACQDVDFSGNAQEITEATDVYFTKKGNNFQVPEEVVEWVKGLRPAHRVRPKIFKSILAHHHDLVKCAVLVAYGKAANDPQLPTWETDLNLKIEAVSSQFLTREQIKLLIDLGDLLVKATRDLANNPVGVNYDVDKLLGTNKHVFGILGPHTESNNRPFMPKCKAQSEEAVKKFHNSKLHPSCRNWAKAAAADICAQIMETTGKTHLSLNDVKSEWLKRESHFVFEAHLPSLIPLSFVEKIIIPKSNPTD